MSRARYPRLPRLEGGAPRQAHADLPAGTYEREFGRDGFSGPATHLLHAHPPTAWVQWEGPLRPRAFDLGGLDAACGDLFDAPTVLRNDALALGLWVQCGKMRHLVRNADGDQLLFVHRGAGDLFCDFGHLAFGEGDYLLLPRGTQWRIESAERVVLLCVEAREAGFDLPERGLLGRHAVFDPAVLEAPRLDDAFVAQRDEETWQVRIKRRGQLSRVTFPFNPLDTVAWQGEVLPLRLNWRDIRPVMSARYHLPPSAHTTFVSDRFVICTFCPRPLESDSGALKVPFFHSNNDYDEVIFYHAGDFFSRDGMKPGMLTLHPAGFAHGPHPKAAERAASGARTDTDEVAVMIDCLDALDVLDHAERVEWDGYVGSWNDAAP